MPYPPRRRLGHHALILNRDGAVLLLEAAGTDGYVLPGGSAERNELPHLAARRHTETATGLVLSLHQLLAADHTTGQPPTTASDSVYWGGRLTPVQESVVARHRPPHHVRAAHWIHHDRLSDVMAAGHHPRAAQALAALADGIHLPFLLRGIPAG
ncbi:NUDIX domain-containing protein [Kitasatospora sp. NPDC047058]|uniref:NUDIX domain-containing protein n=1 Tax=Kitasatospora sp. NPDC047058 TaxID=3155620 RepID=UPI0033E8DE13